MRGAHATTRSSADVENSREIRRAVSRKAKSTPSLRVSPPPHITALYTPIAKNPPAKAAMTYLCVGGRGTPDQSSYAIAPLDPARVGEGQGWAMNRTGRKRAGRARRERLRSRVPGSARTYAHGRTYDATLEAVSVCRPAHRATARA